MSSFVCPNCNAFMDLLHLENQFILHCVKCGCSFFEENAINRISLSQAQKLSLDKATDEISGKEKLCPKDGTILESVQSEAIPPDVSLLKCTACKGILTYPEDLVEFKKAQEVKISYFRVWKRPLPSLRVVLVFSFFLFTSLSILTSLGSFSGKQTSRIQASEKNLIKNNAISGFFDGQTTTISFRSNYSFENAKIFFVKKNTEKLFTKTLLTMSNSYFYSLSTGDAIVEKDPIEAKITVIQKINNNNIQKEIPLTITLQDNKLLFTLKQ